MRREERDLQHVGLPTACAVVYAQVSGITPDPRDPAGMQAVLNDVAHALSNLVTIYVTADLDPPRVLLAFELIGGTFIRGAHAFKTRDGKDFDGLTVQRRDMLSAIKILKAAKITFTSAGRRPLR